MLQTLIRMAEIEADPAEVDGYRAILSEEIEASVAREPDVLTLHAFSAKDRPASIRVLEIHSDQEACEAHLGSPHFLRYKTMTSGTVRSLRLIEADPILLRADPCIIDGARQ